MSAVDILQALASAAGIITTVMLCILLKKQLKKYKKK